MKKPKPKPKPEPTLQAVIRRLDELRELVKAVQHDLWVLMHPEPAEPAPGGPAEAAEEAAPGAPS